jgi:riboflavin transporter FmnP
MAFAAAIAILFSVAVANAHRDPILAVVGIASLLSYLFLGTEGIVKLLLLLVGIVCAVAHATITGNWVGALMNSIMAVAFILPATAIYTRSRTFKSAMIGLVVSIVVLVVAAVVTVVVLMKTGKIGGKTA